MSAEFEECVADIDAAERLHGWNQINTRETISRISSALERFCSSGVDPRDDFDLVFDYAFEVAEGLMRVPYGPDPVLTEYAYRRFSFARHLPHLQLERDAFFGDLQVGLEQDEPEAKQTLTEVCADGWRTHRLLLFCSGTAHELISLAHRFSAVDALYAAVSPSGRWGRVADHEFSGSPFIAALDALGHLAAQPDDDIGAEAREALLGLAADLSVAGIAAIRLPAHLLTDSERLRLADILEARIELFDDPYPIVVPLDERLLRDTQIIREVLFHTLDARNSDTC